MLTHSTTALQRELVIQQSLQDPRVEQVDDAVSLALQKVNHATMLVSRWDENTLDHKEILALLSLGEEMNVLADRANAAAQEWNTNNAHKAEEESLYNLFWSCLSDKPASMVRFAAAVLVSQLLFPPLFVPHFDALISRHFSRHYRRSMPDFASRQWTTARKTQRETVKSFREILALKWRSSWQMFASVLLSLTLPRGTAALPKQTGLIPRCLSSCLAA